MTEISAQDQQVVDYISSELVDINHPWVVQYRVPVITGIHPRRAAFIATVAAPGDERLGSVDIDEDEASLISQYIDVINERYASRHYIERMKRFIVDVDPGCNTISLVKSEDGWRYRKMTWDQPIAPFLNQAGVPTLEELLGRVSHQFAGWLAEQRG